MDLLKKLAQRFLPMSETAFYILLALVEERHGYAVMQEVEKMTAGRVRLGAGTLYGTLAKLENEKLIRATAEIERRKLYRITEVGLGLLELETTRLEELLRNGLEILKEEK